MSMEAFNMKYIGAAEITHLIQCLPKVSVTFLLLSRDMTKTSYKRKHLLGGLLTERESMTNRVGRVAAGRQA